MPEKAKILRGLNWRIQEIFKQKIKSLTLHRSTTLFLDFQKFFKCQRRQVLCLKSLKSEILEIS